MRISARLGVVGRLADGFRHFARLAMAEADAALLIAHHHQRGETEAAAALHHLGDTIDVHQLVDEFVVALFAVTAATALARPLSVPLLSFTRHRSVSFLRIPGRLRGPHPPAP